MAFTRCRAGVKQTARKAGKWMNHPMPPPSDWKEMPDELQLVLAREALRRAAETLAEPTPHETLHVLVADDNATNRFVATRLLEMFGCTHETVENGAEALEAAAIRPFDLILMDIQMPVMDGVR